MNAAFRKVQYCKPAELCVDLSKQEKNWLNDDLHTFTTSYKQKIETIFINEGYTLRLANYNDIIPSIDFSSKLYGQNLANEISAYDIYRFITFGHGLLVEDQDKNIRGCIFEVGYDTIDRTSFSIRLGIDTSLGGKDFGRWITVYSCLLAMERGSIVKRGFIEHDNLPQIYIQLNKVGWVFDSYFYDVEGMVPTYTAVLPLDNKGLLKNKIDMKKIIPYIEKHRENADFMLANVDDLKKIQSIYKDTNFKISGCIKAGLIGDKFQYIALPDTVLGLK